MKFTPTQQIFMDISCIHFFSKSNEKFRKQGKISFTTPLVRSNVFSLQRFSRNSHTINGIKHRFHNTEFHRNRSREYGKYVQKLIYAPKYQERMTVTESNFTKSHSTTLCKELGHRISWKYAERFSRRKRVTERRTYAPHKSLFWYVKKKPLKCVF
jgi:hypothetical protein